jgi:hypothetical protein
LSCQPDAHTTHSSSQLAEQNRVHFIAAAWDNQSPDTLNISVAYAIFFQNVGLGL